MPAPLVVGGGPAGAAAAILLARAGARPTLLERSQAAHHKVCGDFLSAEAVEAVEGLGLDLPALAPARITGLRLVHGKAAAETALPFAAIGLSRLALDEALLGLAAANGADIRRGCAARRLAFEGGRLAADAGVAGRFAADDLFLATGKHDLRGVRRSARPSGLVAFKTYFSLTQRQQGELGARVELVLFAGGYAGLQPVEGGRAVLCVLASQQRVGGAGGAWSVVLAGLLAESPHLARRLAGGAQILPRPLAIARIPYGFLHRPTGAGPTGLYRIGDQAAVIPSLAGDGIAIALASAAASVAAWRAGHGAAAYHHALRGRLAGQMRAAMLAHRWAGAGQMQPWLVHACRLWPWLMRFTATLTRCYQTPVGRQPSLLGGI